MRATIRQVAERAGVSRTTVSNVLLGRNEIVAADKREMVLQAVRELDYVPVRPTLQNRHVETRVIAVPVDNPRKISWAINSGTYTGMCEAAMEHGYDVTMLLRPNPDWAADRSSVQLLDRRSDGIVFASPIIGETLRTFESLAQHEIPAVVCYRRDLPPGLAWVDPDNEGAMYGAVDHLVAKGHTRIAHLTKDNNKEYDKVARRRYFIEAVKGHGLSEGANLIFEANYYSASPDLVREIIAQGITAVVCMNDLLANDLVDAAHAAGLSVPEHLSVVGVDGAEAERHSLTSMGFDFEDIGRAAVNALVELIQGVPAAECSRVVPVQLLERGSVKDLRAH